jgi:hypothetical protein
LGIGRAPGRRFLLGGFAALVFHLAAVEAHRSMLDCGAPLAKTFACLADG